MHGVLLFVGFLLAFQAQPHTGQGPPAGFGDGFAAFLAKGTALSPGQAGPGPPYLVSYGILDLLLYGIVARPAYRHGAPPQYVAQQSRCFSVLRQRGQTIVMLPAPRQEWVAVCGASY